MFFYFCLASPLLFLTNALLLGIIASHYNPKDTAISQLVYTDVGIWQTLNFLVFGVLSLWLSFYIYRMDSVNHFDKILVASGALAFGLCLVLVGIFKTDLVGTSTITGTIHSLVFISTVVIQGILQMWFASRRINTPIGIYYLISGIVTLIALVAMNQVPSFRGIAQRTLVAAITLWITTGSIIVRI
ncbi:MAG: DUF998 domain-containing protein [Patescibacteria group bacterium]